MIPVYKVSIIPRGRALGVTMFLPEEDRYSLSRQTILSQICSLYGGRIAEEMTLGQRRRDDWCLERYSASNRDGSQHGD